MGKIPFWEDNPQLWDTVSIGGVGMPGIASVTGGIGRKVDVQSIDGDNSGGTQTVLGYEGAKVTVTLLMWRQEHLDAYQNIVAKYRPQKDETNVGAIDIIHPALVAAGIRSVTLERLGIPEKAQQPGFYTAEVQFLEFIPKTKAGSGGTFTINGSTDIASQDFAGAEVLDRAAGQNNTPATTPPAAPTTPPPPAVFGPQLPVAPAPSTPAPPAGGPAAGLILPDPFRRNP